jgi:hypothetical protein
MQIYNNFIKIVILGNKVFQKILYSMRDGTIINNIVTVV